jgi:succinate dehydrogenase / fumarate reductase membrane anchor subunit
MATRSFRSPLGRAVGLGSAKDGVHHWWGQRVSGLALVPLTLWFVWAAVSLAGAPHVAVLEFIYQPIHAIMLILLALTGFHHGSLGMQVIYEDYIGHEGVRLAAIVITRFAAVALALAAVFATCKIAFGAA